jgi:hypothetical protein
MGRDLVRISFVTSFAVLLGAFLAVSLVLSASASAYLYWGDRESIVRTNLNGSGVTASFIPNLGILSGGGEVYGSYLYFARQNGVVGRAHLNGTDVDSDLFTIPQPPEGPESREVDAASIAFAGGHIYWSSNSKSIGRAALNGKSVEPEFIKTELPAAEVGIYGEHIYWVTERQAIARANLDGGDVEPDFIPLQGIPEDATSATENTVAETHSIPLRGDQAIDIHMADGYIYWTSLLTDGIGRMKLEERHVEPHFISDLGYVGKIVTAGRYIYWVSDATQFGQERWIGRANINGTAVIKNLVAESNTLQGLMAADTLGPGGESPPRHRPPRRPQRSK